MKNVHILPTNKLSKGYILGKCIKELSDVKVGQFTKTYYLMFSQEYFQPHNICITSDEKPKEGDWCLWLSQSKIIKCEDNSLRDRQDMVKKIILTDNKDLIKDGIQPINDEFLEWFVNNPSCEFVEVESFCKNGDDCPSQGAYDKQHLCNVGYKIIIPKEEIYFEFTGELDGLPTSSDAINYSLNAFKVPKEYFGKEEPKQETLEEAAERLYPYEIGYGVYDRNCEIDFERERFIEGAEWQMKRSYSEEDFKEILTKLSLVNPAHLTMVSDGCGEFPDGYKLTEKGINYIIEQIKKK